jgi:hypothetical protein
MWARLIQTTHMADAITQQYLFVNPPNTFLFKEGLHLMILLFYLTQDFLLRGNTVREGTPGHQERGC